MSREVPELNTECLRLELQVKQKDPVPREEGGERNGRRLPVSSKVLKPGGTSDDPLTRGSDEFLGLLAFSGAKCD